MPKIADRYLKIDPWKIVEEGFHADRSQVSESIFSLGNEFMGSRGSFDEGFSGQTLIGNYLNGVYEEAPIHHPNTYKGISTRHTFMVNSLNWFDTQISCDGEILDLAVSRHWNFLRELDLKTGIVTRSFVWGTQSGKEIKLTFRRFLSMDAPSLACQRIELESLKGAAVAEVRFGLDFNPPHVFAGKSPWVERKAEANALTAILGETENTRQFAFSAFAVDEAAAFETVSGEKRIGRKTVVELAEGEARTFTKRIANIAVKKTELDVSSLWKTCMEQAGNMLDVSYDDALAAHTAYWSDVWKTQDIVIEGDDEQQQGIRYCIFQLHQTYHGVDAANNVGAKGLTGEAYSGHTFWDTETYCLPFYLFNNPKAARNLLEYRYHTLPQALDWSKLQDCTGAAYPMSTIDGTESCGVWWHGNLEIHVSAAVAYGIWHYMKICDDAEFLFSKGVEMLIEISRFYASRGNWSPHGEFGFYGVMGPDEFHTFVNNNTYTNVIARKTFEWTQDAIERMATEAPDAYAVLVEKLNFQISEKEAWEKMASAMKIPMNLETGVYEQHDGYFELPHLDINSIPVEDFPLYGSWSLPRIYRYDMIKQPDVLLLQLFFSADYSLESKKVNYEYYEPRCIHESSLSPSVHSILAAEIGNQDDAVKFSLFATRLDLDNYNRNTSEGLHTTSIAAAWMNIVCGFGGMRTDGELLAFRPTIPPAWKGYSFSVTHLGAIVKVSVAAGRATFEVVHGDPLTLNINGAAEEICAEAKSFSLGE
ncbi:glycoside hydrolase family 65 protein [Pontiella sulfatireligans]|uniref:Maltose phosphorylase n=1 Tax=Pontiella sulfatireligans TaxID=2750658 RepID=A0A6C2URQ9_9BACT|nr:glycosyl hydrolase family 65 protein [Pontiella sulfatireligans]VGO21931.1 Maltose phosphorylase [Pontiella sulfatireligans]